MHLLLGEMGTYWPSFEKERGYPFPMPIDGLWHRHMRAYRWGFTCSHAFSFGWGKCSLWWGKCPYDGAILLSYHAFQYLMSFTRAFLIQMRISYSRLHFLSALILTCIYYYQSLFWGVFLSIRDAFLMGDITQLKVLESISRYLKSLTQAPMIAPQRG